MKIILTALLALAPALATASAPPAALEKNSHNAWLAQIGAKASPYTDFVFGWYEAQKSKPLPAQVQADPDKIFVSIDAPLAEAVAKEGANKVTKGTSFGSEIYGLIDANVDQVLETLLFRWGKPIGQRGGVTFPVDTVFPYREERLNPEWAPNAYKTITFKRDNGFALDLNDIYSLVVRGNSQQGYTLVGSFFAPFTEDDLTTQTTSYVNIVIIRPTADGKTDYRTAGMLTGQDYSPYGPIEKMRLKYGFNHKEYVKGAKAFFGQVKSLKDTGRIPERRP